MRATLLLMLTTLVTAPALPRMSAYTDLRARRAADEARGTACA